jgi:hypothetical protein
VLFDIERLRRKLQDRPPFARVRRDWKRARPSQRTRRYRHAWRLRWCIWSSHRRASSWVLKTVIGYGYYPGRALWGLTLLTVIGLIVFWSGYGAGSIVPTDKDAYGLFKQSDHLPSHYDGFHSLIYSFENVFPLVKLGQADRWQPDPDQHWQCKSSNYVSRQMCPIVSPASLRWFRWIQVCLGWFFATMGVAAVTGIVRKD